MVTSNASLDRPQRSSPSARPRGAIRVLLFASGTKPELIAKASVDRSVQLNLGATVLLTSLTAGASVIVAAVVAFGGAWWRFIPLGMLYALVILVFDRFLVSIQMNPFRFRTSATEKDAPMYWPNSPGIVLRTLLGALPRICMSVVVGALIAEPILLILFHTEIEQRVGVIQTQLAEDAEDAVDTRYATQLRDMTTPREGVPELKQAQTDLVRVNDQIDAARVQARTERRLAAEEASGSGASVDGKTTSGLPTCGRRCHQHIVNAEQAEASLLDLEVKQTRLKTRVADLEKTYGGSEHQRIADLAKLQNETIPQAKADAKADALDTSGLLIRIDALHQIAVDPNPYVTGDNGAAAEPSPRHLFGLTTLGMAIWIVRAWLIILDTMPVVFKTILSLRSRRPYDAVVAQEEERVLSSAVRKVARIRRKTRLELDEAFDRATTGAPTLTMSSPQGQRHLRPGMRAAIGAGGSKDLHVRYRPGTGWVLTARKHASARPVLEPPTHKVDLTDDRDAVAVGPEVKS